MGNNEGKERTVQLISGPFPFANPIVVYFNAGTRIWKHIIVPQQTTSHVCPVSLAERMKENSFKIVRGPEIN